MSVTVRTRGLDLRELYLSAVEGAVSLWKRCQHRGRSRDNCNHPWWVVASRKGERVQVSIEEHFGVECRGRGSKTAARRFERDVIAALEDGAFATAAVAEPTVVALSPTGVVAFVTRYCTEYGAALKSLSDRRYRLMKAARFWTDREVTSLERRDLVAYFNALRDEGASAGTIRRHKAYLHHAFGWAVEEGILTVSPFDGRQIKLADESDGRTRRLLPHEELAIREVGGIFVNDIMTMALDEGFRAGTIRRLQVGMIKWTAGRYGALAVPGRALKSGKMLVLPMTARVRVMLERRLLELPAERRTPEAHLFGHPDGRFYKSPNSLGDRWRAALKAAGLADADLHFHDLRGESASRLADLGVPIRVIQKFLGHSTIAMTERYLRLRVGALEDAVELLDQYREAAQPPTGSSTLPPAREA